MNVSKIASGGSAASDAILNESLHKIVAPGAAYRSVSGRVCSADVPLPRPPRVFLNTPSPTEGSRHRRGRGVMRTARGGAVGKRVRPRPRGASPAAPAVEEPAAPAVEEPAAPPRRRRRARAASTPPTDAPDQEARSRGAGATRRRTRGAAAPPSKSPAAPPRRRRRARAASTPRARRR